MKYNNLNVQILSSTGSPILLDDLNQITGVQFGTLYPGGLYGTFSCYVPRKITQAWQVAPGNIVRVYNGLNLVWEGRISRPATSDRSDGQGVTLNAIGYWGDIYMRRLLNKPWCDTRIGQNVWIYNTTVNGAEKCTIDRNNRLRFTPKFEAWLNSEFAALEITVPTGQTIKRFTLNYTLAEGAQQWTLGANDTLGGAHFNITASGSGTQDITPATPRQTLRIFFQANANQTPPSDGTIYGQVSNVKVYTETGSINLTEITKDVRALTSEISTSEGLIGSNTFVIEPFISDPPMTLADILVAAASYGDVSYNSWSVGIRGSHLSSDSKPILFAEAYPVLTDYDYALRVGETNIVGELAFSQDVEDLQNYIIVEYQKIDGGLAYATPADDAALKDLTSIASYGERHGLVRVDTTDVTKAKNVGKRVLAAKKDLQWRSDSQISVLGYIRDKFGAFVPACEILAGKRVKIENWLNDLSGTGLTFLISSTNYNDVTETCTLGIGKVDDLAVFLSRLAG